MATVLLLGFGVTPVAAATLTGTSGSSIVTRYTWCESTLDYSVNPVRILAQAVRAGGPVVRPGSLRAASVRWTVQLQWAAASGGTWQTLSGTVRKQTVAVRTTSSGTKQATTTSISIPVFVSKPGTVKFRTVNWVEYLDAYGRVIAGATRSYYGDLYQTNFLIGTQFLGQTTWDNHSYDGICLV
ncbi:MAG: hypothetical protein A2V85_11765 [Chloroflexi bacterium RBG_16_72_14]|nr:MAG: hypothetical protein A2V85_11765 [Chloroflexi bacterium RBG_16_72_14]